MRDVYLLAAGVLGLVIPMSSVPQLLMAQPASDHQHEGDNQKWLQQVPQPNVEDKVASDFDSTAIESSFNRVKPPQHRLLSGSQLYYHRLAALKAGQIYTGLADDVQLVRISARKPQLTYLDWKRLLALEARAIARAPRKNRLNVLVGDSLSLWFPTEKLPKQKLWLNQGISGDTSEGISKRLSAFSHTKPDAIYVMAGINDLRKGADDKSILNNHRRIVASLKRSHPQSSIIIQSILPTRLDKIPNSRILKLNKQLATIAQQENVNFINIYDRFTDNEGKLRSELTTDGLHLSQKGYDVWGLAIAQTELKLVISRMKN